VASSQKNSVCKEIRVNSEHHHNFLVRVALGSREEGLLSQDFARLLQLRKMEATLMSHLRSKRDRTARRRKRDDDDEDGDEEDE